MKENIFYVAEYAGDDDDARIAACLREASSWENATVVFAGRDFLIGQAILMYPGMTILVDNCTIRQKDNTFDNMFRGANIHLDPENPYAPALSIEPTKNLRLIGQGKAVVEGCSRNRRGYHPVLMEEQDMTGDYWGFLTYQVLLAMTDQLEIGGLTFTQTRCWAITLDGCTNFHMHDMEIYSQVKNGDGIHLLSGCHHGIIERISGITSDDTVAVQSGFRLPGLPYKNYLAPFTPMDGMEGDRWYPEGLDCHDILIRDIRAGGMMHNVILLPLNGTSIYNVTIENITDTCYQEPYFATVFLYTGIYGEPGRLRDIVVKNIDSLADTCFVSNTSITNLLLSDLSNRKENGRLYGTYRCK